MTEEQLTALTRGVRHLSEGADRCRRVLGAGLGISNTEIRALGHLYGQGTMTPRRLGQELTLTTGSMTPLLDRLAAVDLVERSPNPTDRRSVIVSLTDRGTDLMVWMHTHAERQVARAIELVVDEGLMAAEDIARLTRIMTMIGDELSAVEPDDEPGLLAERVTG